MSRRLLLPLVLIVATIGVVAATWSNSSSSRIPFIPQANTHRANWTFGKDGSTTLPDQVKFATNFGIITTVVTTDGVPNREQWSDLIATRYTPGSLDGTDVTRQLWRTVQLRLKKPDGSKANVEIARPLWWFEEMNHNVGDRLDLEMHELGIAGEATILSIGPCDADSRENPPKSQIVIGTIEHENAIVLDLVFNNDLDNPLGVTASHPIYSEDRDDWVAAGDLEINESVRTINGVATLTGRSERPGRHKVYNLEVHRAHSYHVSDLGILAHNTGIWTCGKAGSPVKNAFGHWKKHRAEFPELHNAKQYADAAKNFYKSPPKGALTKIRPKTGEKLIYDPATNTFAAYLPDGTPKTFFRPDVAKHGFPTNLDYFHAQ